MNCSWIPLPFLIWALYTDVRIRKITNKTTYPLILLGFTVQILTNGPIALAGAFTGICLYLLLSSRLRTLRIGGGDLKLIVGCLMFLDMKAAELFIVMVFFTSTLMGMIQYACHHGAGDLIHLLKLDIMTAGTAPQEAVHVMGALVILVSYGIAFVIC